MRWGLLLIMVCAIAVAVYADPTFGAFRREVVRLHDMMADEDAAAPIGLEPSAGPGVETAPSPPPGGLILEPEEGVAVAPDGSITFEPRAAPIEGVIRARDADDGLSVRLAALEEQSARNCGAAGLGEASLALCLATERFISAAREENLAQIIAEIEGGAPNEEEQKLETLHLAASLVGILAFIASLLRAFFNLFRRKPIPEEYYIEDHRGRYE